MLVIYKDGPCQASGYVTKQGGNMQYMGQKNVPKYTFSVCYRDEPIGDGKYKHHYIDCEFFGFAAKNVPALSGGESVHVDGYIKTKKWKGRDGGEKEKKYIQADFVMVMHNTAQNAAQTQMNGFQPEGDFDDEPGNLPF